jgi:hypothetical protein
VTFTQGPQGNANYGNGPIYCQTPTMYYDGTPITNGQVNNNSYIDPGAAILINKLIPLPNATPTAANGGENYINQLVLDSNGWQLNSRLDYNFNDNNKLYGTYKRQDETQLYPSQIYYTPYNSVPYPTNATSAVASNTSSVNYTHVFNAAMTNELAGSFTSFDQPFKLADPAAVSRTASDFPYVGFFNNHVDQLPGIYSSYTGLGIPLVGMTGGFENGAIYSKKTVPIVQDNLTRVFGKHLAKAGVYFEKTTNNQIATYQSSNGQYGFDNPYAYMYGTLGSSNGWQGCGGSNPICFNSVADLVMGLANSFQQTNYVPDINLTYNTFAFYLTDEYKLNKKLTLTYGVRFDHLGAWHDPNGKGIAIFEESKYAADLGDSSAPTNRLPGFRYHGNDSTVPTSGITLPTLFVSPRFGVAYDLYGNGKSMLRGGWGQYRYTESYNDYGGAAFTASGSLSGYEYEQSIVPGAGGQSRMYMKDVDSFYSSLVDLNALTFDTSASGFSKDDHNLPVTTNYNFTLNQQLPWNTALQVGFVGNQTDHQLNWSVANLNALPVGALNTATCQAKIASYYASIGQSIPQSLNSLASRPVDECRSHQYYSYLGQATHSLSSNYNSLQASLNKQKGNLIYGVNFTWEKALGTWTGADPINVRNDYGIMGWDRTHILNATYSYKVPTMFKSNPLLKQSLSGWEISGITTLQSGPPLQSAWSNNLSFGGTAPGTSTPINNSIWLGTPDYTLMPTLTCNPTTGLAAHQYVNGNCFGIPSLGSNGPINMPYMRGPAYFSSDLSTFKTFNFGEKRSLQLRLAGFNFLNHPIYTFGGGPNVNTLSLQYQSTPNTSITNATGAAKYLEYPNFGVDPFKIGRRVVQLGMKYEF